MGNSSTVLTFVCYYYSVVFIELSSVYFHCECLQSCLIFRPAHLQTALLIILPVVMIKQERLQNRKLEFLFHGVQLIWVRYYSAIDKLNFLPFFFKGNIFFLACCFVSMGSFCLVAREKHLWVMLNVLQFLYFH